MIARMQKPLEKEVETGRDIRREDDAACVLAVKQRAQPLARLKNKLFGAVASGVAAA